MSSNTNVNLTWEWPAERQTQIKLLATIDKLSVPSSGFFGLKKSPSIVDSVPDPKIITATIISDDTQWRDKRISLTIPAVELGEIQSGDAVALGIVEGDICICIAKIPTDLAAKEQSAWLSSWQCKK